MEIKVKVDDYEIKSDKMNDDFEDYWIWFEDGRRLELDKVHKYYIRTDTKTGKEEHVFFGVKTVLKKVLMLMKCIMYFLNYPFLNPNKQKGTQTLIRVPFIIKLT